MRIWLKLKPEAFSILTGISPTRLRRLEEDKEEPLPKEIIVFQGLAHLSEYPFL